MARPPPRPIGRRRARRRSAIGVPVPSVHAFYFEVFDLSDLDHTLRVLGIDPLRAPAWSPPPGHRAGPLRQRALAAAAGRRVRRRRAPSPEASSTSGSTLEAADPDLEGLTHLVQRHGRPTAGAHRTRGTLQLRREPRAAVTADDTGGGHGGARGRPGQAPASVPAGPATPRATTSGDSSAWSGTCSRCLGPTPARSTSSSGGQRLRARAALGRDGVRAHGRSTGRADPPPVQIDPGRTDVAGGRRQTPLRAGHGQPDGERRRTTGAA